MKKTKRLAALMLAVVMVFALGSTALAAPETVTGDGTGVGAKISNNEELVVKKTMIVTNTETGLQVAYPEIIFSYDVVGSVGENASVTDADGDKIAVREGVLGGLTIEGGTVDITKATGTVKIFNGLVTMNANGQEAVQGNLNLHVNPDKFPSPGVYRYKISDVTTAETLQTAGIERNGTFDADFFLDVYIKNETPKTGDDMYPLYYKFGFDPTTASEDELKNPDNMTTDQTLADDPPVAVDVDGVDGQDKDDTKYPNGLEVGGYVLMQDEPSPNAITPSNAQATKESGLDDVDLTTGGTVQDTNSKNDDGTDASPVYEKTDGTTTSGPFTDSNGDPTDDPKNDPSIKKDSNGEPIQATDGNGHPIYEHSVGKLSSALNANDLAKSDVYNTYNVSLKKTVEGSLAETDHEFPFNAIINNNALAFTIYDLDENAARPVRVNSVPYSGTTSDNSVTLNHDETVSIYGLSPLATVQYKETNDTESNYEVTAANSSGAETLTYVSETVSGNHKLQKNGTATTTAAGIRTAFTVTKTGTTFASNHGDASAQAAITYNNKLTDVSPTGIALRYAPYLFMLAAAAMFVVLSRKERDAENA